jgi:hypothetical protein
MTVQPDYANQAGIEFADISFETSASQKISMTMRTLAPVSQEDVRSWIKYWLSIHYLQ